MNCPICELNNRLGFISLVAPLVKIIRFGDYEVSLEFGRIEKRSYDLMECPQCGLAFIVRREA